MNKATKKYIVQYVVAPLLLVVLLLLIYHQVKARGSFETQWKDMLLHLRYASRLLLVVAFLLTPLNWMTEAAKWHFLLQKIEKVSYLKSLSSTLTGMAFALVTPNKIGDFAGRILYLKNENKLRAIIATVIDNISQLIITFIAGIIGLVFLNIYYPGQWQVWALVAGVACFAFLLFLYFRINKIADWAEGKPRMRKALIAIRVVKRYNKKDLLVLLLISLLRFSIYNLQFVLFLKIFGAEIPFFTACFLSAVMFWMITVIPSIFIADLGVRAYVANLIFIDTGITNSITIIASSYVIWLLNWVLAAVIGSILILTIRWFR